MRAEKERRVSMRLLLESTTGKYPVPFIDMVMIATIMGLRGACKLS